MPRYFFHVDDGTVVIDREGVELSDLMTARREAIRTCGEMIRESPAVIWSGKPWRLWVTDRPDGAAKKLFALSVFSEGLVDEVLVASTP